MRIFRKLRSFDLDVDFEIHPGEILGLMGHSGAGKSMILKCIAGLEQPDGGKIAINGRVLYDKTTNVPANQRNIGYCFQNYALFDNYTAVQNIRQGLTGKYKKKLSRKEQESKVQEMIELFALQGLEGAYPRNLSGGQKQRIALARMMISDPDLYLFDEPFSAIDTDLKEGLYIQLKEILAGTNKPCIIVSHDAHELDVLCDRILKIEEGKIVSNA